MDVPTIRKIKDLTGQTFGRLLVVGFGGLKDLRAVWECQCSCGRLVTMRSSTLRKGHAVSCGCYSAEQTRERATKHGHTTRGEMSSEYTSWHSMKQRCNDQNKDNYERYGGRGIRICEQWESFEIFLQDMGHKPTTSHTIERINNDGNYEPGNCRWALKKEQSRNRRNNRHLTIDGVTRVLSEWAELSGVNPITISGRISRGWSIESAVWQSPAAQHRSKNNIKESVQ